MSIETECLQQLVFDYACQILAAVDTQFQYSYQQGYI